MRTYSEHIARVSTALADPTRREIMEYVVHADSPLSVREVAENFGLHANAARIHLDKLVKGGLLQVIRRRGERGGRPANLYGASDEDLELSLPPRKYKLLAEVLASGVASAGKGVSPRIGREAFKRGREEAIASSSPLAYLPQGASLTEIKEAWSEEIMRRGHKASMRECGESRVEVTFATCPFGEFSRSHPGLVCEVHRCLEEGYLSLAGGCKLEASDLSCVFVLSAAREERRQQK
ncbi:MAG: ArsR family transcriptional regulator [Actinobacteria bacterium]|jgi:predicted ArsR family transcriptional regulator|nr:MAG: ArsR family transcriptional regulator [Actinomycetota bacterium]